MAFVPLIVVLVAAAAAVVVKLFALKGSNC